MHKGARDDSTLSFAKFRNIHFSSKYWGTQKPLIFHFRQMEN